MAYGRGIGIREFFFHRLARLYPLHLATPLFVAAIQGISQKVWGVWQVYGNNDWQHFILQLFMAADWLHRTDEIEAGSFNAPIWTVSVEIFVYFIFLAYLRSGRRWLAPVLALVGLALAPTNFAVFQCMWLFFVGVSLFRLSVRYSGPLLAMPFVGVSFLGAALWWAGLESMIPRLCVYLGAPALLLLFVALDYNIKPLPKRWHWIGISTYSIYLLHMPLLIFLRTLGDWYLPPLPNPSSCFSLTWTQVTPNARLTVQPLEIRGNCSPR